MHRDVESKLDRLVDRYMQAAAELSSLAPLRPSTTKGGRRTQIGATDVLGRLRESRMVPSDALVRLAFVRGLRDVAPQARLGTNEELEVGMLSRQLARDLTTLERAAGQAFSDHLRRMRVAATLREMSTHPHVVEYIENRGTPYPLEQRARASIRSILEIAAAAGALAATQSGSYDGEPHA